MKKVKMLLASLLLAVSSVAMADGVMMEMFEMNRQLNGLSQAESSEAFQASVDNFLKAANKAEQTMPASLEGDTERFKGYQQGMQEIIGVVEQANSLAKAGKLDEAKALIEKLRALKKHYHQEYK